MGGWFYAQTKPNRTQIAATNVYAAALDEAKLLQYAGTSWSTAVTVGKPFWGVWGTSGTDIYLVGACTVCPIVRYDGATAVSMSGTGSTFLYGVWGAATGDVYAVGQGGTILRGVRGATVTVTPATPTLTAVGATQQLTAAALSGSTPITGVTGWAWSSATPSVATVNATSGLVTAVANGTAVITATAPGGASGTTTVILVAGQFSAVADRGPARRNARQAMSNAKVNASRWIRS